MRLVSDALYNKMFSNIEGDPTTHLANEKNAILNNQSIPDEMKPQLYHQAVRNVTQKMKEESEKPIPVSHESLNSDLPTTLEKNKRKLLDQWLSINGIYEPSPGSVMIRRKSWVAKLSPIKAWLLGERDSGNRAPAGLNGVHVVMTDAGLPKDFFEYTQSGRGCKKRNLQKRSSSCSQAGRGCKKKVQKKTHLQWKTY